MLIFDREYAIYLVQPLKIQIVLNVCTRGQNAKLIYGFLPSASLKNGLH